MKLNLASGDHPLPGYTNVDLFEAADVQDDLLTLARFADACAEEVRCDHGLEHVPRDLVPQALNTWCRVLRPGGKVAVDVPNLPEVLRRWVERYDASDTEIWGWWTHTIFGRQTQGGDFHLWGFDRNSLAGYLTGAGFVDVEVTPADSHGQPSLLGTGRKPARASVPDLVEPASPMAPGDGLRASNLTPLHLPGGLEAGVLRLLVVQLRADQQDLAAQLKARTWGAELLQTRVGQLQRDLDRALLDLRALQSTRSVRLSRAVGMALAGPIRKVRSLLGGRALIHGAVDLPEVRSTHAGAIQVAGWAHSIDNAVAEVRVLLDKPRVSLGVLQPGLLRPDVLAARPWQRDDKCGYSGTVRIGPARPGRRTLIVRVTDDAGNCREFRRSIVLGKAAGLELELAISVDPMGLPEASGAEWCGLPPILIPQGALTHAANSGHGRQAMDHTRDSLRSIARSRLQAFLASGGRIEFPAVEHPTVSVVIPTFNQAHVTLLAIESLLASEPDLPFELVIVDNASTDETRALLERLDNVRLQLNPTNLGFGPGCNLGAGLARAEHVCFLNSDCLPTLGWLTALVRTMGAHPDCGAVGARLVQPDGRLQEAGGIVWQDGSTCGYGRDEDALAPEYAYLREVDYCSAACLMVRKSLYLELGGFDDRYSPAYYEDTDLCLAVWQAGYRVLYQPDALVYHLEHGSGDYNGAVSLQLANRARFVAKWGEQLGARLPASDSNRLLARDRRSGPRIVVIDDRVPQPLLGSGFPRTLALLRSLAELGHAVTFLPRQPESGGAAWPSCSSGVSRCCVA